MSERNGDRSRFNRERRQKALRRLRNRALTVIAAPAAQATGSPNEKKSRTK